MFDSDSRIGPDLLETVVPAAAGATRRLTTKEKVKARLNIGDATEDAEIDASIDALSDRLAGICNLSQETAGIRLPTFGAETLRGTWYLPPGPGPLIMPWRPAIAVTIVNEDQAATNLVVNTDYRVADGFDLVRLNSGWPQDWFYNDRITVTFTCGWVLPAGVPPGLEEQVISQLVYDYWSAEREDPAIRSENIDAVYSASYAVPGGDSIDSSGLIKPLLSALARYRRRALG